MPGLNWAGFLYTWSHNITCGLVNSFSQMHLHPTNNILFKPLAALLHVSTTLSRITIAPFLWTAALCHCFTHTSARKPLTLKHMCLKQIRVRHQQPHPWRHYSLGVYGSIAALKEQRGRVFASGQQLSIPRASTDTSRRLLMFLRWLWMTQVSELISRAWKYVSTNVFIWEAVLKLVMSLQLLKPHRNKNPPLKAHILPCSVCIVYNWSLFLLYQNSTFFLYLTIFQLVPIN